MKYISPHSFGILSENKGNNQEFPLLLGVYSFFNSFPARSVFHYFTLTNTGWSYLIMFRIIPPPLFEGPIPNMENIAVQNNPLFSSAMQTCLLVLLTGLSTVALLGLIFFWEVGGGGQNCGIPWGFTALYWWNRCSPLSNIIWDHWVNGDKHLFDIAPKNPWS